MPKPIHAGSLESLREEGAKVIKGGIAVFYHEDRVFALDNRCPHLGFPLHQGSLCDGILTCHWHHARFDVCSGGTLDPWADDIPTYEVTVDDGEVWVHPASKTQADIQRYKDRLRRGRRNRGDRNRVRNRTAQTGLGIGADDLDRDGECVAIPR